MFLSAQQKISILKKVLQEGFSVSSVCRENHISRKTFYLWQRKYSTAASRNKPLCLEKKSPKGLKHPRGKKERFKTEVLRLVVAHPQFGSHSISSLLLKKGKKLGNHAVYTLLKGMDLESLEKRKEFSQLHRSAKQIKDIYLPGPQRLLSVSRKRMVEEVLLSGRPISEVARRFKVSRKTVWKWTCRYKNAQTQKNVLLSALSDQHPAGAIHPRGVSQELEKKVLDSVIKYPKYSVHRLTQFLQGQIGHHGVQNIFIRNGLNTYQKRRLFAETVRPASTIQPATGWVDRPKTVFETFTPQVASAPPPGRRALLRTFLATFVSSSILSFLFILWLQMLAGKPLDVKLGLVFATTSLMLGMFFFLYSLKYYFNLTVVLAFSRQVSRDKSGSETIGEETTNNNSNPSLWQRIFGRGKGSGKGNGYANGGKARSQLGGLQPDLSGVSLERQPFVSIHLATYNEKRVVDRLLTAVTSLDYPNFEVVVVDDSTDETQEILSKWNANPRVKVFHRESREGYKGGALQLALENTDSRSEFILVFDADFLPYPDTITQFLKYFQTSMGGLSPQAKGESNIAAVQGYQWHVLNKSENWVTRGVRSEYAGSYVIERSGEEALGSLKQIAGSVYMIRREIMDAFGWGTSITEDFELTLRLYRDGYKVVYTPYIQTPSECVSTLKRLIRQRMRWAEGHSHNIKRMFWQLMAGRWESATEEEKLGGANHESGIMNQGKENHNSLFMIHNSRGLSSLAPQQIWIPSKLTWMEKLEFLYLSPYYLQASFFILGTLAWFISEALFQARLPFWTSLWGWSLVFTNLLSLPLVNTAGLFLEESEERDYGGILSFIILTYLVVPFQAYAALKGLLEEKEGPWFRTPKTGKITDIFTPGRFTRFISAIFPGRGGKRSFASFSQSFPAPVFSSYLALASANNQFENFKIKRRRPRLAGRQVRWISKAALTLLLTASLTIFNFTRGVPEVSATSVNNYYLWTNTTDEDSVDLSAALANAGLNMRGTAAGATNTNYTVTKSTDARWYSRQLPTGTLDATIPSGSYTFNIYVTTAPTGTKTITWRVVLGYCWGGTGDACGTGVSYVILATSADITYTSSTSTGLHAETVGTVGSATTCTEAAKCRLYVVVLGVNSGQGGTFAFGYNGTSADYITNLAPPSAITVPENVVYFVAVSPFIPVLALWLRRRKGLNFQSEAVNK